MAEKLALPLANDGIQCTTGYTVANADIVVAVAKESNIVAREGQTVVLNLKEVIAKSCCY